MNKTVKRALISVYDKEGIVEFAQFLAKNNVEIISTGKTYKVLREAGVKAIEISEYTKSPEIMGGRVKTLHPKIHGGILGVPGKHNFDDSPPIDLVVVNLYPFVEISQREGSTEDEVIEQIDIGGVTLIRAAAKNFHHVCVITNVSDYKSFVSVNTNVDYRRKMCIKAFSVVAEYDNAIQKWISGSADTFSLSAEKAKSFRYGENPHQTAHFFTNYLDRFPDQVQGKELSYNNIIDAEAACKLVLEFVEPTVAIIKHTNPCGVASDDDIVHAYTKALQCDTRSSFGGIVAVNQELNAKLATKIITMFTEVVIAPGIDDEARKVFEKKQNIRVLIFNKAKVMESLLNVKSVFGGFLVQDENNSLLSQEKVVTNTLPQNIEDLYFAWKVCKHVKSNAIVLCKDKSVLGIGAGQMSRVDSMNIAINKAQSCNLKGAVIASDAFFPFDDCVKLAAEVGINAIIQPGGSIRDQEVIDAANRNNIAMLFTGMRHFNH